MTDSVASDDRGYLYGDGLFETVRVEEGRARFLKRHKKRFEKSATILGFPEDTIGEVLAALDGLAARGDGLWRVTATRPGKAVFGGGSGSIRLRNRPLPKAIEGPGIAVTVLDGFYFPGNRLAEHKTTSWIRSVEARRRAERKNFDEAVLCSADGQIGEAAAANIFVRIGGGWVTPPVDGILPGVVRAALLDEAKESGLHIEERPVYVGDFQTCESLALTSSGRLVTAVAAVDHQPLETAPVQELSTLLQES